MSGVKRLKLAEVVKANPGKQLTGARVNQALSTESMANCKPSSYKKK